MGSMDLGEVQTVTINAVTTRAGSFNNTATVTGNGDGDKTNNQGQARISVLVGADSHTGWQCPALSNTYLIIPNATGSAGIHVCASLVVDQLLPLESISSGCTLSLHQSVCPFVCACRVPAVTASSRCH